MTIKSFSVFYSKLHNHSTTVLLDTSKTMDVGMSHKAPLSHSHAYLYSLSTFNHLYLSAATVYAIIATTMQAAVYMLQAAHCKKISVVMT